MNEQNANHQWPTSLEEQARTGNYGMVAEAPVPNRGPFWITPSGQLVDANGMPVLIAVNVP